MNDTNTLFPVFLKTEAARFLIVGGGNVGLEKAQTLLKQNPYTHLKVVATEIFPAFQVFLNQHPHIEFEVRPFQENDLDAADFVIAATNDKEVNATIKKLANQRNILVNAADQPELCDFYLGSIVRKGHLKIAISTNGKSPVLARRMREYLEEALPDNVNETISALHSYRNTLKGDFHRKLNKLNKVTKNLKNEPSAPPYKFIALTIAVLLAGCSLGYAFSLIISAHQLWSYLKSISNGLQISLIGLAFLAITLSIRNFIKSI